MKDKIKATAEYKRQIKITPFLDKILLKKSVIDSIERIVYQIQKFGVEYIEDKQYPSREVIISKEIIFNDNLLINKKK